MNNLLAKKPFAKRAVSKGPVENLETYVKPEWWREIFNSNYLKTDGDVVDDQNITETEVNSFIEFLNPSASDQLLDVCCGHGRHVFEFYKRGYTQIEGIDRSAYLISRARDRAKLLDVKIKFREGDARKLPYDENSFDVIMILGNSFGYFESQDDDLKVLLSAAKVLKPDGKILLDVADGNFMKSHFKPKSWEWINKKEFVCRERCLSASGKKLISREVITHTEKGVIADQFYSENLYGQTDLQDLLDLAGYKNICFHSPLMLQSQRSHHDPGMMENRLVMRANK